MLNVFLVSIAKHLEQLFIRNSPGGVATNNGLGRGGEGGGEGRFKPEPCLYVRTSMVQKRLMFLHPVNNIGHDIKQNIYTGMVVISFIPPWYCALYCTVWMLLLLKRIF